MIRRALALLLSLAALRAAEPKPPPVPKNTAELEQAIRKVLAETKTPGAGVSIVSRDRVLWTAGIGKADVARGLDVTPDTLFRIGSVSKSFVSLSVLKLEHEGKLHLTDTAHSLAPEIGFQNPWEATDPVRIVNLLEHTAGFDDLHFAEYANNDPTPITLRAGLDYHPDSRVIALAPGHLLLLFEFRPGRRRLHRREGNGPALRRLRERELLPPAPHGHGRLLPHSGGRTEAHEALP